VAVAHTAHTQHQIAAPPKSWHPISFFEKQKINKGQKEK